MIQKVLHGLKKITFFKSHFASFPNCRASNIYVRNGFALFYLQEISYQGGVVLKADVENCVNYRFVAGTFNCCNNMR